MGNQDMDGGTDGHCFLVHNTLVQGTTAACPNETDVRQLQHAQVKQTLDPDFPGSQSWLWNYPSFDLGQLSNVSVLITLFADGYSN